MLLLPSISLQSAVNWLSLNIKKWECSNANLTMIEISMQLTKNIRDRGLRI